MTADSSSVMLVNKLKISFFPGMVFVASTISYHFQTGQIYFHLYNGLISRINTVTNNMISLIKLFLTFLSFRFYCQDDTFIIISGFHKWEIGHVYTHTHLNITVDVFYFVIIKKICITVINTPHIELCITDITINSMLKVPLTPPP